LEEGDLPSKEMGKIKGIGRCRELSLAFFTTFEDSDG
jgi:hypothetical protein